MSQVDRNSVLARVSELIRNFPGREYSGPIERETPFFAELGFASIDAVVLGEMIEQHYGRSFNFGSFLASARDRGAEDITVGELCDFIEQELQS